MKLERGRRGCVVLLIFIALSGCSHPNPFVSDPEAYETELSQWKTSRLERLKGENGWLNLAGLLWLEEGENTFGSDSSNDIIFPPKAESFCGTINLADTVVILKAAPEAGITLEGDPVTKIELKDDQNKNTTRLRQGDLAWYIIRRGDRYAIRLRDLKHPRIDELDHIPSFPVDLNYVVKAELVPFGEPRTMTVATPVEGFTESYQCPGELHFRMNGKKLKLYPFISGKEYFLVFADETTGIETYGAGRFMYANADSAGNVILDFNRAYNPPCAFSPFATCPMPPRENFLDIRVEAGEKAVHLE
jgi:uncharacterized protein (DUF1684 family)